MAENSMKKLIYKIVIALFLFTGAANPGTFAQGLYNNTSFAIVSWKGNLFSGMQTVFGYKFNPHLGLGGGVGIERLRNLPT